MSVCVASMYGTACSASIGYGNRSCGRHICVFEDAERDEVRVRLVIVCFALSRLDWLWQSTPLSRSASVRLRASRSGITIVERPVGSC